MLFQSSVGAEKRHGAGLIDGLARTDMAATLAHLRAHAAAAPAGSVPSVLPRRHAGLPGRGHGQAGRARGLDARASPY